MWYRPFLWMTAVAALCGLAATQSQAAGDDAIAYDQIERILALDAPVPAPDAFAANEDETRAEIVRESAGRRGIARLLPALGRRSPGAGTLAALADDLRALGYPRIERHIFYRGWERVEDLVTGIVVLHECDAGIRITIDPQRRTYRVDDPIAYDRARLLERAAHEQAGHATIDVVRHAEAASAQTIEGVATSAIATEETLSVTDANGSCRPATILATSQTYFALYAAPRSLCPRPAPGFPSTPLGAVARDGCRPAVQAHLDGPSLPRAPLVLYRLLELTDGHERVRLLTARGSVHPVADPAPLFEVPSGYTKAT